MRYTKLAAGLLLVLGSSTAWAQSADPAAANRALIGEGPNVTVQQSAIGTLDVGGPGAANPKLIGENLRGNLGASRAQQSPALTPTAPNTALPNYSFQAPNFGTDLGGPVPGHRPTANELNAAEGLILSRFRAPPGDGKRLATADRGADGWRYQYFNGRWWYWKPNETWAYWNGTRWVNRDLNM